MPRTAVPPDLEDALDTVPGARKRFESLPTERSASLIGWIEEAQLPQTRRRRVAETVRRLVVPAAGETTVVAPPPRSHGAAWLIIGALLAGLAALILWSLFGDHKPPAKRVVVVTAKTTVPHVVGIKVQAARFQLREAKLGAIALPRLSKKPVGIVLGQKPAAGTRTKAGTVVTLVVSKGRPHVSMPKLVGLKAAAAVKVLQGVKLVAQLHAVSSSQTAGTVIGQSPRAGGAVSPRSHVVLEIARGSRPTTTAITSTVTVTTTAPGATTASQSAPPPAATSSTGHDYRGLTLAQAIPRLGREQAVVVYAASSRPAGVIVSDAPVGARERLTVSAGPSPSSSVQVPDVTGEDASQAQSDLRSAGLTVVAVQWPVGDQANDGMVVYESPGAGGSVPRGAAVVVYVGSFSG
jgi:beta-lactam-binding protein with PASTA domain